MDSRLRFLPRRGAVTTEGVTQQARRIRVMEVPDQGSRHAAQANPRGRVQARAGAFVTKAKPPMLYRREKPLGRNRGGRHGDRHRWAGLEGQGERDNSRQGTLQVDPVTSGEGVPPAFNPMRMQARSGRRNQAQATVY